MDTDQRERVRAAVLRVREYEGYRKAWLADPIRNLCSSAAIERMALRSCNPHYPAWTVQMERYNAVLEALHRVVKVSASTWTLAQLEMEAIDNDSRRAPSAWDYAVTLATILGLKDVDD